MRSEYWREHKLNGVEVTLRLDTKSHTWEVWFGSMHKDGNLAGWRDPDLRFTRAKGNAIIEFLQGLKKGPNHAKE